MFKKPPHAGIERDRYKLISIIVAHVIFALLLVPLTWLVISLHNPGLTWSVGEIVFRAFWVVAVLQHLITAAVFTFRIVSSRDITTSESNLASFQLLGALLVFGGVGGFVVGFFFSRALLWTGAGAIVIGLLLSVGCGMLFIGSSVRRCLRPRI